MAVGSESVPIEAGQFVANGYMNGYTNGHVVEDCAIEDEAHGTARIHSASQSGSVPTILIDWPANKNSGVNGTNMRVILEAMPPNRIESDQPRGLCMRNGTDGDCKSYVFVMSAESYGATQEVAENLARYVEEALQSGKELRPADLAFTLAQNQPRLNHLIATRARTLEELVNKLTGHSIKVSPVTAHPIRLGFVFNGQGGQWHAMGRELLTSYPVFVQAVDKADQTLHSFGADWSLLEELSRDADTTRVFEPHLCQTITVALQLCLVLLLRSWNINPAAIASHSSGEIAAAFSAGAISFEKALAVAYYRDHLLHKYQMICRQDGAMLAAGIGIIEAKRYITNTKAGGRVAVACVNSPQSVTFAGDVDDINEILAYLERDGRFARKLQVSMAYHSHHMLAIASEYGKRLVSILPAKSSWTNGILFASPVTGGLIEGSNGLKPDHWVHNLTEPVLFSDAFDAIADRVDAIIEIGPHGTLAGPIRQILGGKKMPYASCLERSVDAVDSMQELACMLLNLRYPVSLRSINALTGTPQPRLISDRSKYPWEYITSCEIGSGLSGDARQPRFPRHELLGLPVSNTLPLAVEWRNILRSQDLSWLAEYRIGNQTILSCAALIAIAIEAVRLLSPELSKTTGGYQLHNIQFLATLAISNSASTELWTRAEAVKPDHSYEIQICSLDISGIWTQNFRGHISMIENEAYSAAPDGDSLLSIETNARNADQRAPRTYSGRKDPTLDVPHWNAAHHRKVNNQIVDTLYISRTESQKPQYVIHPTTLDRIMQSTHGFSPARSNRQSVVLPKYVSNMFVPCQLYGEEVEELLVVTELENLQTHGFASSITAVAVSELDEHSTLRMEGLYCQILPRGIGHSYRQLNQDMAVYRDRWIPDVLRDIPTSIQDFLRITLRDLEATFEDKMVKAAYYFVVDTFTRLQNERRDCWSEHHRRMFGWMLVTLDRGKRGQLGPGSTLWSNATKGMKQMLFDELSRENAAGLLLVRVGTKLADILQGQTTARELMMEGDLLNKYFLEAPKLKNRSYVQLAQVVRLYAMKHPGAKVLEIGGAIGSATLVVLEAFSDQAGSSGTLLEKYVLTDPSENCIETAQKRLKSWNGLIDFQMLNIDEELHLQSVSVAERSSDLIIASMLSLKTNSIEQALKNMRKLLAPGGHLLLLERTQDKLDEQLVFGFLSERWSDTASGLRNGTALNVTEWDTILRRTGFTGVDFEVCDCEEPAIQSYSIIISTDATPPVLPLSMSIVNAAQTPNTWNVQVTDAIQTELGASVTFETWDNVSPDDKLYIFTGDMTGRFLDNLDQNSLRRLREIFSHSRGVLWLSCDSVHNAQSLVLHGQTQEFLRMLRIQDRGRRYIHLNLNMDRTGEGPWSKDNTSHIVHVLKHSFDENLAAEAVDWEYAVKDNLLQVPRVLPDNAAFEHAARREKRPFHQPGQSLMWQPSESSFVVDGQTTELEPGDGMIEIEVKAFGTEFTQTGGIYDADTPYDAAGVITRVGPNAQPSGLCIGDRVCGVFKGCFASMVQADWATVTKFPDSMSFEDAACVPTAYATATYALLEAVRLAKGETILIHSAEEHVSQAAIIVALGLGANVFVTTSAATSEHAALATRYGLASDHVFSAQDVSMTSTLKKMTHGRGVDVVFSTSSSKPLGLSQSCVAPFSRWAHVVHPATLADRPRIIPSSEVCTMCFRIDIMEVAEHKPHLFHDALDTGMRLYKKADPKTLPLASVVRYPVSKLGDALQKEIREGQTGHLVVNIEEDDLVEVTPRPISPTDEDMTFLVVGGSSDMGFQVTSWLIDQGAGNVLFVSRDAEQQEALAVLRKDNHRHCNLQIRNCDVSSESDLETLLESIRTSMPPIKVAMSTEGVADNPTSNQMDFDWWKNNVQCRAAGIANLSRLLQRDLSRFVLLSSKGEVAGDAVQDAFARHEVANGKAVISITLPFAIETDGRAQAKKSQNTSEPTITGSAPIESVLDLLGQVIRYPPRSVDEAQIILNPPKWSDLDPDASFRCDRRFGTLRLGWQRATDTEAAVVLETASADSDPSAMLTKALSHVGGDDNSTELSVVAVKQAVLKALTTRLATFLNLDDAGEIDVDGPLAAQGVDSIVAVDARNWLVAAGGVKLSIFEILQAASLHALVDLVVERKTAAL